MPAATRRRIRPPTDATFAGIVLKATKPKTVAGKARPLTTNRTRSGLTTFLRLVGSSGWTNGNTISVNAVVKRNKAIRPTTTGHGTPAPAGAPAPRAGGKVAA